MFFQKREGLAVELYPLILSSQKIYGSKKEGRKEGSEEGRSKKEGSSKEGSEEGSSEEEDCKKVVSVNGVFHLPVKFIA